MNTDNLEMYTEYEYLQKIDKTSKGSFFYLFIKRMLDIICSILAVAVFSPFCLITGAAIKLTSKGPVIYKQNRIGKNGKVFTMFCFFSLQQSPQETAQKVQ